MRSGSFAAEFDRDREPRVNQPGERLDFSVVLGESHGLEMRKCLGQSGRRRQVDSRRVGARLVDPFELALGGRLAMLERHCSLGPRPGEDQPFGLGEREMT